MQLRSFTGEVRIPLIERMMPFHRLIDIVIVLNMYLAIASEEAALSLAARGVLRSATVLLS
jgi:hypothetical protein